MDKYIKQLIKEAKKLRLSKEDKTRVREGLYAFIKNNPLPETPRVTFTALISRHAFAAFVLILLIGGAGISFAAEGSAPGDILYPAKRINETVISNLVFSEQAKINWELRRAERRLIEAEKLAARSNLEERGIALIKERFEEHSQKISEKIAEFELDERFKEAAELSSNFEVSLKVHDKILTKIIKSKSNPENLAEPLVLNIRAKSNSASRARIKLEGSILDSSADIDFAIEKGVEKIEERIEKIKKNYELNEELEKQLEWAEELLGQTEDKLPTKAFLVLQQANRIVREIEILLEAQKNLYKKINSLDTISIKDCEGPILESFPRQCATPDGNLIIEEDLEL